MRRMKSQWGLPIPMARPLRLEFEGAYYHVMNRALRDRRKIFEDEADHDCFLALLKDLWKRWGVKIYAYCLMSSHYHLFLQTPQGAISRAIRHLDGLYAQYFNRTRKRDGPLFRGRFKAIVVDADSYLLQLVRYIHLNPVKAQLVSDPAAYLWSSHRLYIGIGTNNQEAPWLNKDTVLSYFEHDKARFEQFIAEGNEKSLEAFYAKKRFAPFLGDDAFTAPLLKRMPANPSASRVETTPQFPDLETLIQKVSHYFEVSRESLSSSRRGHLNYPRNLAIYVASRRAGFFHKEIRKFFKLGTDNAVGRACERLDAQLQANPQWQKDLQNLVLLPDMSSGDLTPCPLAKQELTPNRQNRHRLRTPP